jgi:hypothetical protein
VRRRGRDGRRQEPVDHRGIEPARDITADRAPSLDCRRQLAVLVARGQDDDLVVSTFADIW